ncbi:MAG: YggT family protein, partial [Treponema sp.]|nr:YggT family protein [Treponema sp.]
AVSFILGFFILILILRLIAYLTNRNVYSAFWRVIDTISQPLLFRINRILFGNRIVHYRTSLMLAVLVLGAAMIVLGVFAGILSGLLARLPV